MPPDVKDELVIALLLLPLAETNIRWEISQRISATDTTPSFGGTIHCVVGPEISRALFRTCEHRGCYVRLDTRELRHLSQLIPASPEVGQICRCLPWKAHRNR